MSYRKPVAKSVLFTTLLTLSIGCQGIADQLEEAAKEQLKQEGQALFEEAAKQYPTYMAIASPFAVTTAYSGKVWYRISDENSRFDCPEGNDARNGTLVYDRTADTLVVQVKGGIYCGKDTDGRTEAGILDPTDKRSPQNAKGWQKMFDILTAKFNPASLAGDYSYIWQAGNQDGNTRAFNVHINGDTDGVSDGDAFFGYGKDIGESDGSIQGFICNWAGPGSSHVLVPFAQHQKIRRYSRSLPRDWVQKKTPELELRGLTNLR